MTETWKFLEFFSMHSAKCIFCAAYRTLQISVIVFRKLSFVKNQLVIYFGIFTKFSTQLTHFSMHVNHYYLQSEIELRL